MTTVSSQDFNRNPTSVKRAAGDGPVYITEHGRAAYVMVSISEFRRLNGETPRMLSEALRLDGVDDYELPAAVIDIPGTTL